MFLGNLLHHVYDIMANTIVDYLDYLIITTDKGDVADVDS